MSYINSYAEQAQKEFGGLLVLRKELEEQKEKGILHCLRPCFFKKRRQYRRALKDTREWLKSWLHECEAAEDHVCEHECQDCECLGTGNCYDGRDQSWCVNDINRSNWAAAERARHLIWLLDKFCPEI